MLRDSTVTSSREDGGPKKGPHLPAWAGEDLAHCVPPRHAPHGPMGPYGTIAVTGPHLKVERAPRISLFLFGTGNMPGKWPI